MLGSRGAHPHNPRHCGDPSAPQFKARLFLEELASILLTPLLLWFSLPQCAGERSSAVYSAGNGVGAVANVHFCWQAEGCCKRA